MSKMLGWSGISTLSASFITWSRRLPCRPAGVSRTIWVVPFGGRTISSGRAQGEPGARRLLSVGIAEHDGATSGREVAREVGRQRRLAHATLGVGDHDHRHAALHSRFAGML